MASVALHLWLWRTRREGVLMAWKLHRLRPKGRRRGKPRITEQAGKIRRRRRRYAAAIGAMAAAGGGGLGTVVAGPVGLAVGVIIGAGVGGLAAWALQGHEQAAAERDSQLDIVVGEGDISRLLG